MGVELIDQVPAAVAPPRRKARRRPAKIVRLDARISAECASLIERLQELWGGPLGSGSLSRSDVIEGAIRLAWEARRRC
jgi:hypothetical protein